MQEGMSCILPDQDKIGKALWDVAMHQIQRQQIRTFMNHCLTYSYLLLAESRQV